MKDLNEHHDKHEALDHNQVRQEDNALYETIEFSNDDLKQLRRPNRQPADHDYFMKGHVDDELDIEAEAYPTYRELEAKQKNKFNLPHVVKVNQKPKEPVALYDIEAVEDLAVYNQFEKSKSSSQPASKIKIDLLDKLFKQKPRHSSPEPEAMTDKEQVVTSKSDHIKEIDLHDLNTVASNPTLEAFNQHEEAIKVDELAQDSAKIMEEEHISTIETIEEPVEEILDHETGINTSLHSELRDDEKQENYLQNQTDAHNHTQDYEHHKEDNEDVSEHAAHQSDLPNGVKRSNPPLQEIPVHDESLDATQVFELPQEPAEIAETDTSEDLDKTLVLNIKDSFQHVKKLSNRLNQRINQVSRRERTDKIAQLPKSEIEAYSDALSQATTTYQEPILTDQVLESYLGSDDIQVFHRHDQPTVAPYQLEKELIEGEEKSDQANIVKGTAWLSFGSIFSRILGAIYVIPWAAWIGKEYTGANALYSIGYKPYALFLAIATAGFPSAIAKQMAFFHSKKEYKMAHQLFKHAMLVMTIAGVVAALIMYVLAPLMAAQSPTDNPKAAILVIRTLVPALLILPPMSLLRGYFQGFDDMAPMAISQVIEQIIRVIYMLGATFVIMQLYNGDVTQAVAHSTFAAFLGALASFLYLALLYVKRYPLIKRLINEASLNQIEMDFKSSMKLLIIDSIPFIILGAGITIAQNIDTYSFSQILTKTSTLTQTEISQLYGAMSMDADKLIMIIISLATALSTALIPTITRLYAAGNQKTTGQLISHIIVLFSMVMLPAAIGMAVIAPQVYDLFYAANGHPQGSDLLVTSAYMSIVLGAFMVISTVLQSMSYRRVSVKLLLLGLLVKLVLQVPLVALLQGHGALLATTIAFAVTTALMWRQIDHAVHIDGSYLVIQLTKIAAAAIVMGVVVSLWIRMMVTLFGPVGRLGTFVEVLVVVAIAVCVYGALLGLTGQLQVLLGKRYQDLQDKMRLF